MEKAKSFLRSIKPWQLLIGLGSLLLLALVILVVSPYLRQSAKIKLGSDTDLTITADREDTLGAFTDTKFTLRSNKDLDIDDITPSITFFPETEFDVAQISPRQFVITPKTSLMDNSLYKIKVLSEAKTYSWAFQTKNNFRAVQTLPRDKGTSVPVNTGIEVTFSHDNWEDIGFSQRNFEITPSVEGRFERHGRTLSFIPKSLSSDTLYTVKVKKGLKLEGSSDVLSEDFIFKFETRSPDGGQESLGFSRNFYEFSSVEIPAFDIYSSQPGADVSVKIFQYPSLQSFQTDFLNKLSVPAWASNTNRILTFPTNNLSKILEFTSPVQKEDYTSYFMLPKNLDRGYYVVEAKSGKVLAQALFQVTDLSAFLSISGTKSIVWVNDTSTGRPVEKAKVTFAGSVSETAADGTVFVNTPQSQLTGDLDIITVSSGNSTLLLPPQGINYYFGRDYQTSKRLSDKYWSYLYLDRPTYLPEDKVKFWGLLRDRDNLNQKQKFSLEVTKSNYNSWDFNPMILTSQDLETSDMGTYLSEIPLNNYTPGNYGISLKINNQVVLSSSFTVETYTKPAYQISIDSTQKAIFSNESVTFSGTAKFFQGTPVSGMKLKYTAFQPGTVTTDNQGKYSFSITPGSSISNNDYPPAMTYVNITPANPEEGMIQSGTSVAVYGSSIIFGRSKQEVTNNNAKVEIDLRNVETAKYSQFSNPEDIFNPARSQKVTGRVVEYQYVKREVGTYYDFINKTTSPKYEYDTVTNEIASMSLVTDQQGKAVYNMALQNGRSYGIEFESSDPQGRVAKQRVYLYGSSSAYPRDNYVYLKTSKTGEKGNFFSINEKVDLTVMKGESPLSAQGNSRFLYLWAQRGIKSYQISNASNYSFNYPEAFVPNVIVQAVHFTGKTYEVAESLYLNYDTSDKKISLDVSQNKTSYLPGDTAKISVQTKNVLGIPIPAEVNLNLVDEAYYKINPSIADPLPKIYRSLDSDIIASYRSHQYPVNAGGAEMGGCFLAGTQILMSDGTTKSIEKIKVGDSIKTFANPQSKKLVSAKVGKTFIHTVSGYLLINNQLRVTNTHNLYINGRWITAGEARIGDQYLDASGNYKSITSIQSMSGLYNVYNFSVDNQHTYLANGFFVHNDKGRDLFADNAFFGNIKTGIDGRGTVEIKLPDNLTSWRITSQAITSDLKSGSATNPLIVKLPFFVDAVFNTEYLSADRPVISIRAFGDDLSAGESVTYTFQIPTLEIDKQISGKAFEAALIDLGKLSAGEHKVTITAKSSKHSDKLIRSFKVLDSRIKLAKSWNSGLYTDTVPTGSSDSFTKLIFSDQSLGRFFPSLVNFSYSWGDRLDQKLGRFLSQVMINQHFDNSTQIEKLDISAFQTVDGGYAIYPYADADLLLSAYTAVLAADKIDKANTANYFYRSFSEAKDLESASISLFGLASLNEPVLLLTNKLTAATGHTALSRIYLAMASSLLGDTENARTEYKKLLFEFGKTQDSFMYLQAGEDKDDYLVATSSFAALASLLNEPETDNLFGYVVTNSAKENVLIPQLVFAIQTRLSSTKPSAVSFSYTVDNKKVSKSLKNGETFVLMLSPKQLSQIKFSDIKGDIGISTFYDAPKADIANSASNNVSVIRDYVVSGTKTTSISASDLVKITLSTSIAEISQDGCYQISDILPSGLKPITGAYNLSSDTENVWFPYEINGQKVSFCVSKGQVNKPINYYARVVSGGQYVAESALIQSLISPSIYNFSAPGSITIK